MRSVPVGGGCRKNKKSTTSSKRTMSAPDRHLQVPDLMNTNLLSPLCSYDQTLALGNLSSIGNLGNGHFDLFSNPSDYSFHDTMRSSLIENSNSHFLYSGHRGSGYFDDVGIGGVPSCDNVSHNDCDHVMDRYAIARQFDNHNINREIILSYDSLGSSTTLIKQELDENKSLWSSPWQLKVDNNENGTLKESLNSVVAGPSWNNLSNF